MLVSAIVGGVLVVLGACSSVTTPSPLGEKPVELRSEEWNGLWRGPEKSFVIVQVENATSGTLRIAFPENEDSPLNLTSATIALRESNNWVFASIKNDKDDKDKSDEWTWLRVVKNEDTMVVYAPRVDRFVKLVEDKLLPGAVDGNNVKLGALRPEHLNLITSEDKGALFNWEEPLVLTRLNR
jgi:hypothetical protein